MKKFFTWTVFLAMLSTAGYPQSPQRLLAVTHSAGFKHPVLPHARQVLQTVGPRYDLGITLTEDVSQINPANLKRYDGILFYTTGELPIDERQKQAFLEFIRSGKGFVGVHSATDTFYEWPEYGRIIGGYFNGHPWNETVGINVEDRGHPSTRHLGSSFKIADEIYQFKSFVRDNVHVLLSLDITSVDMGKPRISRDDGDFALAWTNVYGKGRIFYTALGHRPEVWDDERFQKHLFEGILWALSGN